MSLIDDFNFADEEDFLESCLHAAETIIEGHRISFGAWIYGEVEYKVDGSYELSTLSAQGGAKVLRWVKAQWEIAKTLAPTFYCYAYADDSIGHRRQRAYQLMGFKPQGDKLVFDGV